MSERQQGETTKQLLAAPERAIYVWPNSEFAYPRALAKHLNRPDIRFYSPIGFFERPEVWRWCTGGRRQPVILDHAVRLKPSQEAIWRQICPTVP